MSNNKVSIDITANNKVKVGFAQAKADAIKAGKAAGEGFEAALLKSTEGTGDKVSKQVGAKLTIRGRGTKTGKELGDEIVDGVKGTGTKVSEKVLSEFKVGLARGDAINAAAKANGMRAANAMVDGFKITFGLGKAVADGIGDAVSVGVEAAKVLAVALAAGGIAAGGGLAAGIVGGLTLGLTTGGFIGLAGFLLKDNEKVSKEWGKTFEGITEDAKRRAGFLEDEFVQGAKDTADAWENNLGPALERIFIATKPFVDDFMKMPVDWLSALAPGVETAIKNSQPAIEGFGQFGTSIMKGIGDGLAELSTHSDSIKIAMVMGGDAIGASIRGVMGFVGELSGVVARNQDEFDEWGRRIGAAADWGGKKLIALGEAFAALSHGVGSSEFKEAVKKLVEGDAYKLPEVRQKDADYAKTKLGYEQAGPMIASAKQAGTGETPDQIYKSMGLFTQPELIDMQKSKFEGLTTAIATYNREIAACVSI